MSIKLSGLVSGMDTDAMVEELVSAYSKKKDKVFKQQKTLSYKQDAWLELNNKIKKFYSGALSDMRFSTNYSLKKTTCSNEKCATITASASAVTGTQELKINQLAKTGYLTGGKIKATETDADGNVKAIDANESTTLKALGIDNDVKIMVKAGDEFTEVELKSDMTLKQFNSELSKLGLNASFDAHNQRFFISSKKSGEESDFALLATDAEGLDALNRLGVSTSTEETAEAYAEYITQNDGDWDNVTQAQIDFAKDMADYISISNKAADKRTDEENTRLGSLKTSIGDVFSSGATKIDGQDAVIELNGATFESTTNTFSINGLTIKATAETAEDEVITLTTDTDVDGIYNKIKDFIKEYNELMTEMYTKYNAPSAGSYEPLTEEEEEALTEKQVEKWEEKLTTAALRKDSTLSSVLSAMRTSMSQSYEINGKSYSLSTFGIANLNYFEAEENERANFHIDGNADDEATSGKEDKLRAAIVADPEGTTAFFSELMNGLYKTVNDRLVSTTATKSAMKIYDDKTMKSQYDSYTQKLADWEKKIDKYRERYEKQFSRMEVAMSKMQSQTSALSSFFGMGM